MTRWRRQRDYGPRPSVPHPREVLLTEVLNFVRAARDCAGVRRIALVGSLATPKPIPKDADVLATLEPGLDLEELAPIGRRLKGRCGTINLGADVFLCETDGRYIGRVCGFRECHPRVRCEAQTCASGRNRLNDDLHLVTLSPSLIAEPPFDLWPAVVRRAEAPEDVERLLLAPLEAHLRPGSEAAG
jgi:hypothetical protein